MLKDLTMPPKKALKKKKKIPKVKKKPRYYDKPPDVSLTDINRKLDETYKKISEDLKQKSRLQQIAEIIEHVDNRCMAHDGPVGDTREEMTKKEMIKIYQLAIGK